MILEIFWIQLQMKYNTSVEIHICNYSRSISLFSPVEFQEMVKS